MAVLTFVVFLPALDNGFVNWDDDKNFINNYLYRGLGLRQLKWMATTFFAGPYQPLSWLTLGFDYLVWGMDPFGYHLTNVLLHSANAAVFYILCLRLLAPPAGSPPAGRKAALYLSAAFAALVFSIHPLRAESVAWVTERRDVLSGLFYFLTILLYLKPRSADGAKNPFFRRHALPAACFVLALLSKGIVVTLPAALIILDIVHLKRLPGDPRFWFKREYRNVWLEKIPYAALSLIFGAVGYFGQAAAGTLVSMSTAGPAQRAVQALFSTGFYLWKTIIPFKLVPLYKFSGGLLSWQPLLAGAAALIITALVIRVRRRLPVLPAVWAFYLVTLSPVLGIVKFGEQAAADRYTYLSCLGFAVLAGCALLSGLRHSGYLMRKTAVLSACLIAPALGGLTWAQTKIWRDSETLWRYTIIARPTADAYNNLGTTLAAQGKLDEAVTHFWEAVRLDPDYADAHYNLGNAQAARGKFDDAVRYFREALRIKPAYADAHCNLGTALAAQGKFDDAVSCFREALRLNPDDAAAHYDLAVTLADQGLRDEAILHFKAALRINPNDTQAGGRLAGLLGK